METNPKTPVCKRCGQCCRAGGPGLHVPDLDLIGRGVLPWRFLVTLRRGERVEDNVAGRVAALDAEMVKIRGRAGGGVCILFDEWTRACRIHEDRPTECRALFCEDDRALREIYQTDRITRWDLLGDHPDLLRRVKEHEARCSWELLDRLVSDWDRDPGVEEEIRDRVDYDEALRDGLVREFTVDPRDTWFLLGRPLAEGLLGLGVAVQSGPGGIRLSRLPGGLPEPAR
ncbi:MAG: YkgJ family cysteine cluster protein [Pseudomonadota bacterium]